MKKHKNLEEFYEEYVKINNIQQYFIHYPKDYDSLTAPKKHLYWIENAGHFTDIDNPKECMRALNEICCSN